MQCYAFFSKPIIVKQSFLQSTISQPCFTKKLESKKAQRNKIR